MRRISDIAADIAIDWPHRGLPDDAWPFVDTMLGMARVTNGTSQNVVGTFLAMATRWTGPMAFRLKNELGSHLRGRRHTHA